MNPVKKSFLWLQGKEILEEYKKPAFWFAPKSQEWKDESKLKTWEQISKDRFERPNKEIEEIFENYRAIFYPKCPSRYHSITLYPTIGAAEKRTRLLEHPRRRMTTKQKNKFYQIRAKGNAQIFDHIYYIKSEEIYKEYKKSKINFKQMNRKINALADLYWKSSDHDHKQVPEIILNGKAEVLKEQEII